MSRVLVVIHYPVFGGPHNQILRLAAPLRDRGWDTTVLLPEGGGGAAERLTGAGIDVVTAPLHRFRASRALRPHMELGAGLIPEVTAIRRLIRSRSVDLVQVTGLVNPHGGVAARLEHKPIVWQLLDTRTPALVAAPAVQVVRALADAVMTTGRSLIDAYPGGESLAGRLVPYLPPVDVGTFRPRPDDRESVRAEWGVPDQATVVGCVANLNPQKGILELVEAYARVSRAIPDARLVLVGAEYATHADYSATVRRLMAASGLREGTDVILVGERSDVERQLAGFDVFAFSPDPRGEGVTTAVLEAMSSGLPVVAASVAGLHEVIQDGMTGRLVPARDVEAMSAAVIEVLSRTDMARALSDGARAYAVEHFSAERCADDHARAYEFASRRHARTPSAGAGPADTSQIVGGWACPACRSPLAGDADRDRCPSCGREFPLVEGIHVLLMDPDVDHDEIEHHAVAHGKGQVGDPAKAAQVVHFDRHVAEEFEISRPHGTSALYKFLMGEKFRRAIEPIAPSLIGATALTVCGGSGMDAEFLVRAGARVVASDISLGAVRRTRERARRQGFDLVAVVADVEHLPFPDGAFDLVLVHDGLHHLKDPQRGLMEMARVARRWVSVTEPAQAVATSLAVRAGLALEKEEAGNRVARLRPGDVVRSLEPVGFRSLAAQRYAMYYRHEPGPISRALSQRVVFPVVRAGWIAGNALIGRVGNKMTVVAERIR